MGKLTFPEWRLTWEYFKSVRYGTDVSIGQRICAVSYVIQRQIRHGNWLRMGRDFLMAGDQLAAQLVEKFPSKPKTWVDPPLRETSRTA